MMLKLLALFAANPYSINAKDIGADSNTQNIGQALTNVTKIGMSVIGGLAIIFLIVGGIQMVLSTGDAKRVQQARETLIYATVGLVLAISAYALVTFFSSFAGK
jgi:hypothetical protein